MQNLKNKIFGFTLVELMVVIGIISLLTAVAIPNYNNYIVKVRVAKGLELLRGIIDAEIEYYNENGQFANGTELNYPDIVLESNNYNVTSPSDYYEYASGIIINKQCSSQRAEIGIKFSNISLNGVSDKLYTYYLIDYHNESARIRCVTHSSTTYTAVADRKFAPANCTNLTTPQASCP